MFNLKLKIDEKAPKIDRAGQITPQKTENRFSYVYIYTYIPFMIYCTTSIRVPATEKDDIAPLRTYEPHLKKLTSSLGAIYAVNNQK
jgi:hypothetical protein